MGGYLFGYDWVVIGGAKIFYEPFFAIEDSAALRGWAMSSALLGCLVGAGFSGSWSDKYGRKKLLILSALLFLLSAVGTGAVDNFSWFIFYRIVGGLGIGIASNVSPIYIAEVSPTEIRGKLVSFKPTDYCIRYIICTTCQLDDSKPIYRRNLTTSCGRNRTGVAMDVLGRSITGCLIFYISFHYP